MYEDEDPFDRAERGDLIDGPDPVERIEYTFEAIDKSSSIYGDRFVTLSSEDIEHLKSGGVLTTGDSEYRWFLRLRKD